MRCRFALVVLMPVFFCGRAWSQVVVDFPAGEQSLVVREALGVESLARGGRSLIVTDPVEAAMVRGDWATPVEGAVVTAADGRLSTWQRLATDGDGVFSGRLAAGYLHVVVRSEVERIVMLHARGHRHVFVHGERRGGDVYDLGITALPILLHAGDNEFLFRGGRGRMRIELREPESALFWFEQDVTKPDVVGVGEYLFSMPLVNASTDVLLGVSGGSGDESLVSGLGGVPPLGVRKMPVRFVMNAKPDAAEQHVSFEARAGDRLARSGLSLALRGAGDRHSKTFISEIDGSVQYYAVTPASGGQEPEALILTLHGASVEARNQAAAYAHKDWADIVAPTNRRPFGFDWEDWGRIDAMEVLERASRHTRPERTYLTGHSMGGHGTWQVGAQFPHRFAAIAPSAGWRDFWSYGGAGQFDGDDAVGAVLNAANNPSRTLLLEENYKHHGVYVLHGNADDNVPVSQARFMRERLGGFHANFAYYERAGAGHWWGNECVDWPPLMDFLSRQAIDLNPMRDALVTMNPAINGRARLFTIHRQGRAMMPTRVELGRRVADNALEATTENVLALRVEFAALDGMDFGKPIAVTLDGQVLEVAWSPRAQNDLPHFERGTLDEPWRLVRAFDPFRKGAHRAGPFKHAFGNRMVFVYATDGTAEENAWALAKARYDAEVWQYRANGAVDVVPDAAFDPEDPAHKDRNVIVYGCADSHLHWDALLGAAPICVERGIVRVGGESVEGSDLSVHFLYPRPGSETALVGVVAGTGGVGRRIADEPRYFISGVGYPDWLVCSPVVLEEGLSGVRGAGYFGADWSIDPTQSAMRR